jgi:uncharacterized membrane protein
VKSLDLRPLSVGEILDRTFTLYRQHFLLFLGISAIPHIFLLLPSTAQVFFMFPDKQAPSAQLKLVPTWGVAAIVLAVIGAILGVIVYLLSQGATVTAVSELYMGRTITISESFRRVRSELGNLFLVILLSGLATLAGFVLLIIPGIYVMCRLVVCIPAALIEDLGPTTSIERSFELTKDNAGRAFLILLLYFALTYAAIALFALPFEAMVLVTAAKNNPDMMRLWFILTQIGSTIATVLVKPVITIASAILYYDLRVRKEAFDLQMMMTPLEGVTRAPSSLPTMLS